MLVLPLTVFVIVFACSGKNPSNRVPRLLGLVLATSVRDAPSPHAFFGAPSYQKTTTTDVEHCTIPYSSAVHSKHWPRCDRVPPIRSSTVLEYIRPPYLANQACLYKTTSRAIPAHY